MPTQMVYGFNLPDVKVSEVNADIVLSGGKILFNTFEIGKDILKDDLVAKVTGDGTLDRAIERSRMNLKASFELSPRTKTSFPLDRNIAHEFPWCRWKILSAS
jgi:hypothetical protein